MNQAERLELYNKFPAVLRDKLNAKEFDFPEGTQFIYESFQAYRLISREEDDDTPLNRNDMRSYHDLGRVPRGGTKSHPACIYSVSLFREYDDIVNALKLPRPRKKFAQGFVFAEGGPQCCSETTSHVDWWLYEDVDLSNFKIREDCNG